jgi:hypothetical protein
LDEFARLGVTCMDVLDMFALCIRGYLRDFGDFLLVGMLGYV